MKLDLTLWILIWGLGIESIAFKWLLFDYDLLAHNTSFQGLCFILCGVGGLLIGIGFGRVKRGL